MRVLAVDDDADFLELLECQFRCSGLDLTTCTSGPRALTLLEAHSYDVVMVDLMMPVMDGRALARHIRRRPKHTDLPIVMMTSMQHVSLIGAARPGDACHFVNKGGEPAWLIHFVSHLAGRRDG